MGQIDDIYKDIQNLNIQGATNVCIATFEGMKLYLELTQESDSKELYDEFFRVGDKLAHARENEPLATNGVTFVKFLFEKEYSDLPSVSSMKRILREFCDDYLEMVNSSKKEIVENGRNELEKYKKILTHCHSSTVVSLIKNISQGKTEFEVVCTETRPLFQGRTTAKNLLAAGIKTTMIADSSAESFVVGRGNVNIEVALIGCDEILADGSAVNKIGSWGIGMASLFAKKPLYVVTPSLKLDYHSVLENNKMEIREDMELWPDAPKELEIYNPAFEVIDAGLITGYITELGVIAAKNIVDVVVSKYPWIVNKI